MDIDRFMGESTPPSDEQLEKPSKGSSDSAKASPKPKFTSKEKEFIKSNYETMTDKQIGRVLGRPWRSVETFRANNNFVKDKNPKGLRVRTPNKSRKMFLATLDDSEKEVFFLKELRGSALYRSFARAYRKDPQYVRLYEQKYVEFMMDPSIETVTSMERDIWHEMTIAQIREMEYLEKEKEDVKYDKDGAALQPSYAKEIAQCQETIRKCQESLNVERRQRLKNSTDSAISFTQVIKELRNPGSRKRIGEIAVMLKYIAEKHYNDHVGRNIISGSDNRYDVALLFKDGKEPEGLGGDFTCQQAVGDSKEGQEALKAD